MALSKAKENEALLIVHLLSAFFKTTSSEIHDSALDFVELLAGNNPAFRNRLEVIMTPQAMTILPSIDPLWEQKGMRLQEELSESSGLSCLRPRRKLDKEVMNAYLNLVRVDSPNFLVATCGLADNSELAVCPADQQIIAAIRARSKMVAMIPIRENHHWQVARLEIEEGPNRKIAFYDSLFSIVGRSSHGFLSLLDRLDEFPTVIESTVYNPQQNQYSSDCGLYALLVIRLFCSNLSMPQQTDARRFMPSFRRRVLLELTHGKLDLSLRDYERIYRCEDAFMSGVSMTEIATHEVVSLPTPTCTEIDLLLQFSSPQLQCPDSRGYASTDENVEIPCGHAKPLDSAAITDPNTSSPRVSAPEVSAYVQSAVDSNPTFFEPLTPPPVQGKPSAPPESYYDMVANMSQTLRNCILQKVTGEVCDPDLLDNGALQSEVESEVALDAAGADEHDLSANEEPVPHMDFAVSERQCDSVFSTPRDSADSLVLPSNDSGFSEEGGYDSSGELSDGGDSESSISSITEPTLFLSPKSPGQISFLASPLRLAADMPASTSGTSRKRLPSRSRQGSMPKRSKTLHSCWIAELVSNFGDLTAMVRLLQGAVSARRLDQGHLAIPLQDNDLLGLYRYIRTKREGFHMLRARMFRDKFVVCWNKNGVGNRRAMFKEEYDSATKIVSRASIWVKIRDLFKHEFDGVHSYVAICALTKLSTSMSIHPFRYTSFLLIA